jgi:hypothetical protein
MSPRLRTAALALLTLTACARDLELPASLGLPVVRGFSPASAWGGQWLQVTGSSFDPTPSLNRVQFGGGASASAERLAAGVLWVRVPGQAASGHITVSNGRGPGAPFGSFTFLGRGELERGQVVEARPLLHDPTAILAAAGSTFFLQSTLWQGLVSLTDATFAGDGAKGGVTIDGGNAIAWIDRSGASPLVVRYDVTTKATVTAAAPTEPYVYLAAVAGSPNRLAVVSTDQATVKVRVLDATTLAQLLATRTVGGGVVDVDAVADAGGQRLVMVARQSASGPTGLLVAHSGGDSWVAPPVAFNLAGYFAAQPLAVATATGGNRIAATVAIDGDLYTANLGPDGSTGPFTSAFSPTPIALHFTVGRPAGLAAQGKYVAVSKGTEGLVLGIDVDTSSLAWSVPQTSPGPATAYVDGGATFFAVASKTTNDALDIEVVGGIGIARARWDFGLFPGRQDKVAGSWVGRPGALAWCGPPTCPTPILLTSTSYPGGVLFLPTGSSSGALGLTQQDTGGVVVVGGQVWGWSEPSVSPGWVEPPSGAPVAIADEVLRVLPDATGAWVVHASGLSRLEGGAILGTSAFPTTAVSAIPPVVRPDGRVVAAWTDGTDWMAAVESRAQVIANQPADWGTLPAEADLLFVADGENWLVVSGPGTPYVNRAYRLIWDTGIASWRSDETVELTAPVYATVALSPNGRTLVRQTSGGLQVRRADPRADFPILSDVAVEGGIVTGFTFDAAGDSGWAVTRNGEKVLTLQ